MKENARQDRAINKLIASETPRESRLDDMGTRIAIIEVEIKHVREDLQKMAQTQLAILAELKGK